MSRKSGGDEKREEATQKIAVQGKTHLIRWPLTKKRKTDRSFRCRDEEDWTIIEILNLGRF
jgi:hypothetical protein